MLFSLRQVRALPAPTRVQPSSEIESHLIKRKSYKTKGRWKGILILTYQNVNASDIIHLRL